MYDNTRLTIYNKKIQPNKKRFYPVRCPEKCTEVYDVNKQVLVQTVKTTWQKISLPWCLCYRNIIFTFTPLSPNCSIYHCPKSFDQQEQQHVTKLPIELRLRPANKKSFHNLWCCFDIKKYLVWRREIKLFRHSSKNSFVMKKLLSEKNNLAFV